MVTDWETVEEDDFYLTDKWLKENQDKDRQLIKDIKQMAKNKRLFIAYIVSAKDYAIYTQMDASQIFIDGDMNEIVSCESAVIDNNHEKRIEFQY